MEHIKSPRARAAVRESVSEAVRGMIASVAERGIGAVLEYARKFDGCERRTLRVSRDEIDAAYREVSESDVRDMRTAHENIAKFARAQRGTVRDLEPIEVSPGVMAGHRVIPVSSCCCYVPGGRYPLYSTALMLITPAKAAGVPRVAACSPAVRGTDLPAARTLVAMDIAGADEIYAVGGVQAVAAMACGVEGIDPVDMIVGPGNAYVAEAKRQCFGQVGIDFVAGPSEVLVIADAGADARTIAADLLAQCEHDTDARGILVTTCRDLGLRVEREVERQLEGLPTSETARASWEANGEIILAESLAEAVRISNERAPEHLELQVEDPDAIIGGLHSCGSLFVGANTAEVFGDYASGPNHTLPTSGAARYTGGLWAGTFLKTVSYQTMTAEGAMRMSALASRMARGEGLEAHARAAEARARL